MSNAGKLNEELTSRQSVVFVHRKKAICTYVYYNLKTKAGNGASTIGAGTNGPVSVKGKIKVIQVRDLRVRAVFGDR